MFTACPPTHTPSHRASRPHCGGYSHPGGEDKQCGKGGEDNHHSNPLLTLHTPLTSHTLYTHSTHTPLTGCNGVRVRGPHSLSHSHNGVHLLQRCYCNRCQWQLSSISSSSLFIPFPFKFSPLTPSPSHSHTQVFVRLPRDRVTW